MKRDFGQAGEALAVEFLKAKGYAILDTNWRCALGELDIVAQDGSTVVIVEVRTRHSAVTSTALETIGTRKQQTLAKLAHLYLTKRGLGNADWRIDAIGIAIPRNGTSIIEHVETRLIGKPLIVILGATAVGKTDLALRLAQAFDGEIVGADSRQIFREMDIGTAKPTPNKRLLVPHHLIDLIPPDGDLSLAAYQKLAYAAIDDIQARGKLPLLVGGTGQYITAVVEGWSPPEVAPNPAFRAELEAFAAEFGWESLFARLLAVDPEAQAFIDPRNIRRVIRALEVTQATGKPFSAQRQKHPPPYRIRQFGLMMDRDRLYERADQRLDSMIDAGFVDEVRRLLAQGYSRTLPSMSGLGYRELAAHLLDGLPLADAITLTRYATHDFIRRQLTWFRGHDQGILWHNKETLDVDKLTGQLEHWLQES